MKKVCKLLCSILIMVTVFVMTSCTNTISIDFSNKLANTNEYSFNIVYTDSQQETPIYISCYAKDGSYAYRFSKNSFDDGRLAYRQIFSDKTFYEISESKTLGVWTGEYKKTEEVDVTYEGNFMYKYTTSITSGSFLTLFQKGKEVEYNGVTCRQFDFAYDGKAYTYVFENETSNLLKFVLTTEDNVKTLEYSDYKFENIDTDCLEIPSTSIGSDGVHLYREVEQLTYEFRIA